MIATYIREPAEASSYLVSETDSKGFCFFCFFVFFGSLTGKRTRAVAVFGKLLGLQQIMPASAGGKCQEPEAVVRHPARVLIHMFKFT